MSLKLALIASLATVSVAGISTGGYFLLKGSDKSSETKSGLEEESSAEEKSHSNETANYTTSQTNEESDGITIYIPSPK